MDRTEIARIVPGLTYRRHEQIAVMRGGDKVIEDVEGGTYRVSGFAFDGTTKAERVVYASLDGADKGRLFVDSLHNFAIHFRALPVEEAPAPPSEPVPERHGMAVEEKVAGHTTQGSGV